jgi:hypothetical protein
LIVTLVVKAIDTMTMTGHAERGLDALDDPHVIGPHILLTLFPWPYCG